MIDWDFYARRSGATLEGFLRDVDSYAMALQKFKNRGLNPPSDEKIMKVFGQKMSKNFKMPSIKDKKTEVRAKAPPPPPPPKKRAKKKVDDEASKTVKTTKKSSNTNDKKYFRKVVSTKNK